MKETRAHILLAVASALCLSSCQMEQPEPTPLVPEMPYRPRAVPQAPADEVQTTTWESAPEPSPYISNSAAGAMAKKSPAPAAPIPDPVVPEPKPQAKPKSEPLTNVPDIKPLDIADFTSPAAPTPAAAAPAPAPTPAAAPKPTVQTGSLPIAARVPGDPTHVWNPMDPSKMIRIIDPKTGEPFPSGKKLKVRGHDFYFIVP